MQYLYKDGDSFHFMDTTSYEQSHIASEVARRLGELPDSGGDDQGRVLRRRAGRHRAAADRRPQGRGHGPGHQGRDRQRPGQAGALETGLVVQVPPFVNTGDSIRVTTETGEYLSRA